MFSLLCSLNSHLLLFPCVWFVFWELNFEKYYSFYLSFSDEWDNFLERIGKGDSDAELQENSSSALELRFWASYRGQTLARTGFKALFY